MRCKYPHEYGNPPRRDEMKIINVPQVPQALPSCSHLIGSLGKVTMVTTSQSKNGWNIYGFGLHVWARKQIPKY
jgi:hypothetical protein